MNAPDSKIDELTVEGVAHGWMRVTTPGGESHYVAELSVAGVNINPAFQGNEFTLRVETDAWDIEGRYSPALLVESASWYSGESDDE